MRTSGSGFVWLLKGRIKVECSVGGVAIFKRFERYFKLLLRRQVNLFIWISTIAIAQMGHPVERVPLVVDLVQKEVCLADRPVLEQILNSALSKKLKVAGEEDGWKVEGWDFQLCDF
jgi:hypothetical protein